MAENIVESLFGPAPWQIQQAQNAQLAQAADKFAAQDPLQRATGQLYRAGGMFANAGADAFGFVNPAVQEAQARQQALNGIDMSSGDSILRAAQGIADPRLKLQLTMLGQQRKEKEKSDLLAAKKFALDARKQDFQETEAFDLKKRQAEAIIRQADERIADKRTSEADRVAAIREKTQAYLLLGQLSNAIKQSGESKPMTDFQKANFKQKVSKSAAELRSVEGATADLEAKAQALLAHPGLPAATGVMGMAPSIPGGDAAKADALIQEFKAAIKKQGLEMAREGGSIGQMTEREWPIVESMVANIDPVKLGLDGTKAQIAKAVAYAKTLTKRAMAEHNDLVSAMPEEIQKQTPKAKVNFGDLK